MPRTTSLTEFSNRPLYQTQEGQWRALSNNSPVPPMTAFGYICRSFRQTTPFVIGAMKLLASSYSSKSLNRCGYSLYCDFRPDAEQWGKRSQLSCSKILSLRNEATVESSTPTAPEVVHATAASIDETQLAREQSSRPLTLEEFEAALDEDHTFDHVDLDYSRSGPRSQV
ncbi:hypothetical protein CC2G_010475 [Coprinopsis cinerea AmutBmut pab1-1]|nr:hypothetical protein CC2G_010475 [Coprinopsis cinerea AmutBmut pab1-1]